MRTIFLLLALLYFPFTGYSQTVIKMKRQGGVSVIPCKVNGLNLSFIFDTGAGDVSISMTEASFMLKNDYLSPDDIKGTHKYLDANGNISEGIKINLKEVEIGGLKLYNVEASIVKNQKAPLLLGQSAISKLGKIQLDLQSNTLTIFAGKNSYDFSEEDQTTKKSKFIVGQYYLGGMIFYVDNTGDHGLIVLEEPVWITNRRAVGNWNEARTACHRLGNGWRLPTKDELNVLRRQKNVLKPETVFSSSGKPVSVDEGLYWSSTQCSNNSSWAVDFFDGSQICFNRNIICGIRAVKSF